MDFPTFCGVWSGSALFAYVPKIGMLGLYGLIPDSTVQSWSHFISEKTNIQLLLGIDQH